jgi:hypothetical protein
MTWTWTSVWYVIDSDGVVNEMIDEFGMDPFVRSSYGVKLSWLDIQDECVLIKRYCLIVIRIGK